tara:strand:+ start:245 stop:1036 length:792 start_codon:yes stop_codon:yes gene_type:complete
MNPGRFIVFLLCFFAVSAASVSLAAGSTDAHFPSYYGMLLEFLGVDKVSDWVPTVGAFVTLLIVLVVGSLYKSSVQAAGERLTPSGKISVMTIVDMLMDMVYGLAKDIIGEKGPRFFSLLAGLFVFILFSNLTGLVPGFLPATDSINTNLAMGLVVFIVYNFAGIKEHGAGYIKQFLGPVIFLMPLMLVIELVQHLARPVSLSLRLYGNIFGDHLVLSVFTGLTYLVFPALLLFMGLLVACLQSFVFTLLTSIYISMAVSHDH